MFNMILEYIPAKECKNKKVWYTCLKCGRCGRVFNEFGVMVNDGGTHPVDDEETEE